MNTDNNVNHQSDSRLSISQRNLYVDIVKAYQIRPRRIISKFLITLLCGLKVFVIWRCYVTWYQALLEPDPFSFHMLLSKEMLTMTPFVSAGAVAETAVTAKIRCGLILKV